MIGRHIRINKCAVTMMSGLSLLMIAGCQQGDNTFVQDFALQWLAAWLL